MDLQLSVRPVRGSNPKVVFLFFLLFSYLSMSRKLNVTVLRESFQYGVFWIQTNQNNYKQTPYRYRAGAKENIRGVLLLFHIWFLSRRLNVSLIH